MLTFGRIIVIFYSIVIKKLTPVGIFILEKLKGAAFTLYRESQFKKVNLQI